MKTREFEYYAADFETTVYDGQDSTEVWASAVVRLNSEDVQIHHSIDETFQWLKGQKRNLVLYYHNLKFDGAFWLDYLLKKGLKQSYYQYQDKDGKLNYKWNHEKDMVSNSFKYSISDYGQWYEIIIKLGSFFVVLRDSLKLLPFTLKEIGSAFKTKHQKLDMEYKGYRYAGCRITPEEATYLKNDVLVLKEALEFMFAEGHDSLTIGSCCMKEYKAICKSSLKNQLDYKEMYPNLYHFGLDDNKHGAKNAGEWIRKSYKGGWCYLVKGKEGCIQKNGITLDVNSLYPSMMHSESGNRYPVGNPHFFSGEIPKVALQKDKYYFVRIKTRFYLKPGKLPFVQVKNSYLYRGNEMLETSDLPYRNKETGELEFYTHYRGKDGKVHDTRIELTLTMPEYQLLKEHYNLVDFQILDGCWFYTQIGIFDEYIDKYKKIKLESKGAKRTLAKLFLNNLYGKMASSTDSSFKVAYLNDSGLVKFRPQHAEEKTPGYIAVGSAITGYTREFTIRAAQKNYYGPDNPGFIYADTDSLHCDLPLEQIKGVKIDPNAFCCWKAESCWDKAIFTRQKTYIEHVTHHDMEELEIPYHDIKCAGMTKRCKQLFTYSLDGVDSIPPTEEFTKEEREFLFPDGVFQERGYEDFCPGLVVPGKLMPKRYPGGVVLVETTFKMGEIV